MLILFQTALLSNTFLYYFSVSTIKCVFIYLSRSYLHFATLLYFLFTKLTADPLGSSSQLCISFILWSTARSNRAKSKERKEELTTKITIKYNILYYKMIYMWKVLYLRKNINTFVFKKTRVISKQNVQYYEKYVQFYLSICRPKILFLFDFHYYGLSKK